MSLEPAHYTRRSLLAAAAAAGGAHALSTTGARAAGATPPPPSPPAGADRTAVRPFRVSFPDADLADLRRRLVQTRLPDREAVSDYTQGVPLKTIEQVLHYWRDSYNWRKVEARLNSYPQFWLTNTGVSSARLYWENKLPFFSPKGVSVPVAIRSDTR